jgi:hypothetical protein
MGRQARADVRRYTFDRMIESFEDLFLSALQCHASAGSHRVEAAGV